MDDLPTTAIPTIPIRAGFYFPGVQIPLSAGRKRSVQALIAATEQHGYVFLVHQREVSAPEPPPESFPTVGTLARVAGDIGASGRWEGRVHGITRAWVSRWRKSKLFLSADVRPLASAGSAPESLERLRSAMIRAIELDPNIPDRAADRLKAIDDLSLLTDIAAQNATDLHRAERQRLLETPDAVARAAALVPRFEHLAAQLAGEPTPTPQPPYPAPQDAMGPKPVDDPLQRVRWTATLLARCGGLPPIGVVDQALEEVEGADPGTLVTARTLARQAANDRRKVEDRWPLQTDFDRLDQAFMGLGQVGIVARHDWGLNLEDGLKLFEAEVGRGRIPEAARALLFYHHEQTRDAARGRGLQLVMVARNGDPAELGAEIIDALRDSGLPAVGSPATNGRIEVPIRWRRRMPPDPS